MIKIKADYLPIAVNMLEYYHNLDHVIETILELLKKEDNVELKEGSSESCDNDSGPFLIGEKEYTFSTFKDEILLLNGERQKWIKNINDSYAKEIVEKLKKLETTPENYKKTNIYISGMALADLNAFYGIDFEKMIRAWMTDFGYNVEKICQKATFENYIKSSIDDVYWKFISIGKVAKNETFGFTYQYLDFYLEKCLEEDLNPIDQKFIKEERKENEKR